MKINNFRKKNLITAGILLVFLIATTFFLSRTDKEALPKDLMYEGKPITNSMMAEIVPLISYQRNGGEIDLTQPIYDGLQEEDSYEWHYIGTLPHGDHVVYGYWRPYDGMGTFTEIAIVRRIGNVLKTISQISGGEREGITSGRLENNTLTYHQAMPSGVLYEILEETFPEYKKMIENKNRKELYWGGYMGTATMQAIINNDGTVKKSKLVAFTTAESYRKRSPEKEKEYFDNWQKQTQKNSLDMGDALQEVLDLYNYKNGSKTLDIPQLKEVIVTACQYAE